jgi:predicted HNH restriction endonuclease
MRRAAAHLEVGRSVGGSMKYWRMSFRCGNQGFEMWPHCKELGIAAITYLPIAKIDLSRYPIGEPKKYWNQLEPTQKASIRRLSKEMKKGDVIYVKQGPKIISKGVVTGKYRFDTSFSLLDPDKDPWAHQIPVKWQQDFVPINILLGSEPLTVKELSRNDVNAIERGSKKEKKIEYQKAVMEGELFRSEIIFRKRNRTIIEAKKANSNYKCEICGFSFFDKYGEIGRDFIIAHHVKTISGRKHNSITTINDISLICANCHSMIHISTPPMSPIKLRHMIKNG